jgi:hypothetical protein
LSVVPNIVSEDKLKIIILAVVERLSFYDFASFKMVAQNQKKISIPVMIGNLFRLTKEALICMDQAFFVYQNVKL